MPRHYHSLLHLLDTHPVLSVAITLFSLSIALSGSWAPVSPLDLALVAFTPSTLHHSSFLQTNHPQQSYCEMKVDMVTVKWNDHFLCPFLITFSVSSSLVFPTSYSWNNELYRSLSWDYIRDFWHKERHSIPFLFFLARSKWRQHWEISQSIAKVSNLARVFEQIKEHHKPAWLFSGTFLWTK